MWGNCISIGDCFEAETHKIKDGKLNKAHLPNASSAQSTDKKKIT